MKCELGGAVFWQRSIVVRRQSVKSLLACDASLFLCISACLSAHAQLTARWGCPDLQRASLAGRKGFLLPCWALAGLLEGSEKKPAGGVNRFVAEFWEKWSAFCAASLLLCGVSGRRQTGKYNTGVQ
jgi:hypothetical protein